MVCLFCEEYGYSLELVSMDFAGILPAVISGKCDFASGGIAYTPERAESVYYSDHTYEGGIYEEGTPEEIFEHPKGELTKRFIRNIRVLEIAVSERAFDFPEAYSRIADYCSRNQIPPKTGIRIQLVFEELVQQILIPVLPDPDLVFTVQYSGTEERAEITVDYSGESCDPEQTDNDLSLKLVKGAVSEMRCETTEHDILKNRIRILL